MLTFTIHCAFPWRLIAMVLMGICVPSPGQGQVGTPGGLSLAEAIQAAWQSSGEARAAEHAAAAAEGRARQARAWPNPVLSWGREQTGVAGVSSTQDIFSLEQSVEVGGVRSARAAAARARVAAAQARVRALRVQVTFLATRTYAQAAAAQRRVHLIGQAADAFARAVAVSTRQLAAGDVSGYSHRRLRLEAARYAAARAAAELEAQTAAIALGAMLAPDAAVFPARWTLRDSLLDVLPRADASLDSLVAVALRERADLDALVQDEAAARFEARAAIAGRVPQPAFVLGLKSERLPDNTTTARGLVLGVSIAAPVWDRRSGDITAANAETLRRSAELSAQRRRVAREVAEAFHAWRSAESALGLLQSELGESATRALDAVQVAWTEGEVSLVEWLDAIRAYQEAESTAITLRAEGLIRRAALAHAVGVADNNLPGGEPLERSTR